jgi:hypothetical protein
VILLIAIFYFVGCESLKDLLLGFAILWSTGTLISLTRSLTDFPAAALGILAVFSNNRKIIAMTLLGISGLIKETSVLSFLALPWSKRYRSCEVKRFIIATLIILLPTTLWIIYVHARLSYGSAAGIGVFTFPFFGIAQKLSSCVQNLATGWDGSSISQQATLLFEILCPLSLIAQSIYLVTKPRINSAEWRLGIGFVLLFSILGKNVWVEQYAYCRVLLPLTFSFNLLIHRQESAVKFTALYLIGNGGMCYLALRSIKHLWV